nr:B12-binding domain-containing radical SAM protein [Nanoarchaeota archaeon]
MRILLISPNITGVKGGINRIQPPLGIAYIASVARQAGHDVFIRDTALEGYHNQVEDGNELITIGESNQQIKDFIGKMNPDVVGVTATLSNLETSALNIIKLAKEVNPSIVTVLGGNHITFSNKDFDVDYVIKGEGEIAFVELLNNLEKNIKLNKIINGVHFKDLDKIPFPARDIMNMEGYFKINLFHSSRSDRRVLNVMSSRGCPQKCSFCTTPKMWGRKVRFRSAENVFNEIQECVEKYSIEEVQFEDDTLTLNIKNLYKLCELLK